MCLLFPVSLLFPDVSAGCQDSAVLPVFLLFPVYLLFPMSLLFLDVPAVFLDSAVPLCDYWSASVSCVPSEPDVSGCACRFSTFCCSSNLFPVSLLFLDVPAVSQDSTVPRYPCCSQVFLLFPVCLLFPTVPVVPEFSCCFSRVYCSSVCPPFPSVSSVPQSACCSPVFLLFHDVPAVSQDYCCSPVCLLLPVCLLFLMFTSCSSLCRLFSSVHAS